MKHNPISTATTRTRNAILSAVVSVIAGVGLSLGVAPEAQAASPTTVSGTVTCLNSYVVGVWIQAESSKSGWASWNMPYRLNGQSEADYSFKLNNGGRYQVHVGCGGTPAKWKMDIRSGYVSGTKNSFKCNDIPTYVGVYRFILGQGVPYDQCKKV